MQTDLTIEWNNAHCTMNINIVKRRKRRKIGRVWCTHQRRWISNCVLFHVLTRIPPNKMLVQESTGVCKCRSPNIGMHLCSDLNLCAGSTGRVAKHNKTFDCVTSNKWVKPFARIVMACNLNVQQIKQKRKKKAAAAAATATQTATTTQRHNYWQIELVSGIHAEK